jgi:hypothetical protein
LKAVGPGWSDFDGQANPRGSGRDPITAGSGYFIVAVIALGLPGPDPVTTGLELLPMWALFEGSIWLAVFVERAPPASVAADRFDAVA